LVSAGINMPIPIPWMAPATATGDQSINGEKPSISQLA
jgi:hypothetical protein